MAPTGNLPQQLTSFIGREREIAEVKRLLAGARLLTLTGTGGTGKTRLSLQVANNLLHEYSDGVWFVELAALENAMLVPQAVAGVVGVREEPGRPLLATLVDYFRSREILLLLDNCEHLVKACAALAVSLLQASPNVRVLATSREALGVPGEVAWPVPPLSVPDPKDNIDAQTISRYEAVQLFAERAAYSRPGFTIASDNASAVANICYRLDGLPLAIELAAARIKVLSAGQIAGRLDERFKLLISGSQTALPRHQTLKALLDWSYDLLDEREHTLLCRLSVFAGSFTLPAVQAVCATGVDEYGTIDLLSLLVDKSLLMVEVVKGEARYRLLETIRQYGWDRLRATEEVQGLRTRHRDWYLDVAEEAQGAILSEHQQEWLDLLQTEHDNLRAAVEWSITGERNADAALRLCGALWRFWDMRGYITEGRGWLEAALSLPGDVPMQVRARALNAAGNLTTEQGDYAHARDLYEQALAIRRELGDKRGIASSLSNLGVVARSQDDYESAARLYEEGLALFRELGDTIGIGSVLDNLGFVAQCTGDYDRAASLYAESLALFREEGDKSGIAPALNNLGEVRQAQGDYRQATSLYNEALTLVQELGDKLGVVGLLNNLGSIANRQGDRGRAVTLYSESLALSSELDYKQGIAECIEGLVVALSPEKPDWAARLSGAAEALRDRIKVHPQPSRSKEYNRRLGALRGAMGEIAFEAARIGGRAMTLDEVIKLAAEGAGQALQSTAPTNEAQQGRALGPFPAPPYPAGLTKREVEVLRLVARGSTDAQVGETMEISPRTVQAHLYSIYGKLGVTTRSAATHFAHEQGLI